MLYEAAQTSLLGIGVNISLQLVLRRCRGCVCAHAACLTTDLVFQVYTHCAFTNCGNNIVLVFLQVVVAVVDELRVTKIFRSEHSQLEQVKVSHT